MLVVEWSEKASQKGITLIWVLKVGENCENLGVREGHISNAGYVWWLGSQIPLMIFCLLVSTALSSLFSHWIRTVWVNKRNSKSNSVGLLRPDYREPCGLFLILLMFIPGEARHHVQRLLRQPFTEAPMERNRDIVPTASTNSPPMQVSRVGSGSSSPS